MASRPQTSPIHLYLLAPELIHFSEGTGILLLELMPQRQVKRVRLFTERLFEFGDYIWTLEATKLKAQLIQTA